MTEILEIENIYIEKPNKIKEKSWRYNLDGTYNNKPTDPNYFKNYWRTHYKTEYICPSCDKKILNTEKIKRHELSHLCIKAKNKSWKLKNKINKNTKHIFIKDFILKK